MEKLFVSIQNIGSISYAINGGTLVESRATDPKNVGLRPAYVGFLMTGGRGDKIVFCNSSA